jgi:hypothetical protein
MSALNNTAAISARYSTDRQDTRSIDDQIRRRRAFARDRGLQVVAEFHDAAAGQASTGPTSRADVRSRAQHGRGRPSASCWWTTSPAIPRSR